MSKDKLYLVSYEVIDYGEELVKAKSKKDAIKKVQEKYYEAHSGINFIAEVYDDQAEEETV